MPSLCEVSTERRAQKGAAVRSIPLSVGAAWLRCCTFNRARPRSITGRSSHGCAGSRRPAKPRPHPPRPTAWDHPSNRSTGESSCPCSTPRPGSPARCAGGESDVVEPATGEALATRHARRPRGHRRGRRGPRPRAQADWARAPHFVRAAVLRRAGDLFAAHADELRDWIVRESGSIPGKADFELHVAAQECYEAAALASRPTGQVLPSEDAASVVHPARPGRRRRRDRPVQRPADPLHPLRRPGARARQRRPPQAGPAHRGLRRPRARRGLRRGGTAGRSCCTYCPAAPRPDRRWSPTRSVPVISFTGSTARRTRGR